MAQQVGLASVGTFHERRGDQFLLNKVDLLETAWARVFGETHDQNWKATLADADYDLSPRIDGDLWGIQVGLDLLGYEHDGDQGRIGAFYTRTESDGRIYGNVLAVEGARAGRLSLEGDTVGGYWTHMGQSGRYLDAVFSHTWLDGSAEADTGLAVDTKGKALLASIEGGAPFRIDRDWVLEPQAQLIWQRISLDDSSDAFSSIDYRRFDALTGRVGARLEGDVFTDEMPWQAFLSVDLWHSFSRTADVWFNDSVIGTGLGGTSLEVRGGLSVQVTPNVAVFGSVGHTTSLDDQQRRSTGGTGGIRIRW